MASPTPATTLDSLYPVPTPAEIQLVPPQTFGVTSDSQKTLVRLLKDNHEQHHIFYNDKGFHNHATHHLFAIYTLGAPSEVLEAAYETHVVYQRRAFDSPFEINEANWKQHLGDENFYRSYLAFFSKELLTNGVKVTLDRFVFQPSSNWEISATETDQKKQPQMFNRLLSGVLHPFIHFGHGCEFGSPGMCAEGLAMACVTRTDFDKIIPKSLFVGQQGYVSSELSLRCNSSHGSGTPHSFTILKRILDDPELAPGAACEIPKPNARNDPDSEDGGFPLRAVLESKGEKILKCAEMWAVNGEDEAEVKEKLEELAWVTTLLYGVAGYQDGKSFNGDFFSMHLVTSSIFLSSYLPVLSASSISLLLRSYFASVLTVWIARGRPSIPIASFYDRTSPKLSPPGPTPTPSKETLTAASSRNYYPNTWLSILHSTILHPNEHLCKLQRALAHYASLYGTKGAGTWNTEGIELPGVENLDGTLFARVAGVTMGRLGWLREGDEMGEWDFDGIWD